MVVWCINKRFTDLCVSAALSAVKDTVNVPWRHLSSSPAASSSSGSEQRPRTPPLPGAGGGLGNQVLVMAPGEGSGGGGGGGGSGGGGSGGRKKLRVKKEKASATAAVYAQPIISSSSSTAREESASDTPDEEQQQLGTSEIPERVEQEQLFSAERTLDTSPIEDTLEPAKAPVEEEEEEVQTMPKRVLMQKHFKIALEEIRPSASEEGSLPELRKWAEQFGEGGKRRGKKSGFGKGFGFSDEPVKDRDTGYGKVKQDD